ncbi:P-loop containing nucleoside triphosphate hydrolase protein [Mycena capillaripes]|nr:P-loop containing nucleoside triphosphate hydrolase protein [Mycena capillaripes]
MPHKYRWQDLPGLRTVTKIVKKEIPEWKDGLYPEQHKLIVRVLDGEDIFCCMATGAGKSAIFAVPIIILREMVRNPHLYPDLPVRALPVGMVITPTKGLANIVLELKKLRVPAFAYCHDTVTEARKTGRNLVTEIKECKTWNVICIDPEHLRERAWREITASDVFRANLVYGCTDEAHLINQWGAGFRPDFKNIGIFFRGRLPSTISVITLSATVQPGAPTHAICASLGMSGDDFHVLRTSNERPNTQIIVEPLEHGLGGKIFPQLIPYLNSLRKTVIHCHSLNTLLRIFLYLWKALPPGPSRLRRIKMYHSLRSLEDNEEILRLLDEDPECQVVIATVAFANGLNVKSLLDSISMGFPDTVDQLWQEKRRVGRNPDTSARGIIFVQPSAVLAAQKQIADSRTATAKGKQKKKKAKPMEHSKALVLVEKRCLNAVINRIYENPPLEKTTLDCIKAKRRLPCSLCATRKEIELRFEAPPLPSGITLPLFVPQTHTKTLSAAQKKLRLKKKERELAESALVRFGETVRLSERKNAANQNRPKSSYFRTSIIKSIIDKLLIFDSIDALRTAVQSWFFIIGYITSLWEPIRNLQVTINARREKARLDKNAKACATRRAQKDAYDSELEEEDDENSEESSSSDSEIDAHPRSLPIPPPAKRAKTVLKEVTNKQSLLQKKASKKKIGKCRGSYAVVWTRSSNAAAAARGAE